MFRGELQVMIDKAKLGTKADVDYIMQQLSSVSTFATTRYVDFALSFVKNPVGIQRICDYLFDGTQIQRNYASLYFNRQGLWKPVKNAFELGLIDEIQAFAR